MEFNLDEVKESKAVLAELSYPELLYSTFVCVSSLSKTLDLIGATYQLTKEIDRREPEGNAAAEFLDALSKDLKTQTEGRIQF